jgi:SAM-dependent methyltransferase
VRPPGTPFEGEDGASDDGAWMNPYIDEGSAPDRGEFVSLEEHKARNAALLASLCSLRLRDGLHVADGYVPDAARALREAARVLRDGGFIQFSILHPCFAPRHRKVMADSGA